MNTIRWWMLVGCVLLSGTTVAQNHLIDSLKIRLRQPLPDTARAYACYDIANEFAKKSQPDSARIYLAHMRPICQRARFWLGLGYCQFLRGILDQRAGDFEVALGYFQQAADAFQRSNRPNQIARVYDTIGYLYKQMGESQHVTALTRQGIDYIGKAVAINLKDNQLSLLTANYINLGVCYEDLTDYPEAMRYFRLAQQLAQTAKDPQDSENDLRIIYNDIGNLYSRQQHYTEAIPFLERAVALNRKLQRKASLVHNYRNLATAYLALKQPEPALGYAEQAHALLAQSRDVTLASSVYKTLHQVYAATGQYERAYGFLLRGKAAEDSLMTLEKTRTITRLRGRYDQQKAAELATIRANLERKKNRDMAGIQAATARDIALIEADKESRITRMAAEADVSKTRAVAEVQTRYETAKKTRQIDGLARDNALKSSRLLYLAGGLGLVLLLLGIGLVQYRALRRANARLAVQNQVIAETSDRLTGQSAELRTLMRELHHRVKNNLAIVSSLLSLQTYRLTDTGAIDAMQESQRRVEAMALIHQRLYQAEGVTTINMADYITDLADSLMAAYGYTSASFDLTIQAGEPTVDVDVAIPMGLILNELLTNAFKYAYGGGRQNGLPIRPALGITLRQEAGLILEVYDNGPGLTLSQWQHPDQESDTFGRQLIWSLSEQTGGTLTVENRNGAYFRLAIPAVV